MQETNQTIITDFFLIGFQNLFILRFAFFFLICVVHFVTLTINIFLILLVIYVHHLQTPMYFFLSQLSLAELMVSLNIMPKLLHVILTEGTLISIPGCVTQFYMFSVATNAESFFLALMSYDRYIAICKPLHYSSLMNLRLCLKLTMPTWVLSLLSTCIVTIQLCMSQFCGSGVIDHYYCDLTPLLEQTCTDVSLLKTQIFVLFIPIAMFPFVFIVVTYLHIVLAILHIPSSIGKQKAFSTCSSHLIVVCIYYFTLITVYIIPKSEQDSDRNKFLSLLYTVVTPLCNPIIYMLRNKEIKNMLERCVIKAICM